MKNHIKIYMLLGLILGLACNKHKEKASEDLCKKDSEFRIFFQDSIAYRGFRHVNFLNNLSKNCTNYHTERAKNGDDSLYYQIFYIFLYAFEEEFINPSEIDKNIEFFRFTVKPCFRKPYMIKLEKRNNKTYYTVKLTDGNGGYYTGTLTNSITKIFNDSLINTVSKTFSELNFWTLANDTSCYSGFDGETWFIEAVKNGEYNMIKRWVPFSCGDSTTKHLGKLGIELRELGKTKIENIEIKNF